MFRQMGKNGKSFHLCCTNKKTEACGCDYQTFQRFSFPHPTFTAMKAA